MATVFMGSLTASGTTTAVRINPSNTYVFTTYTSGDATISFEGNGGESGEWFPLTVETLVTSASGNAYRLSNFPLGAVRMVATMTSGSAQATAVAV